MSPTTDTSFLLYESQNVSFAVDFIMVLSVNVVPRVELILRIRRHFKLLLAVLVLYAVVHRYVF